jgi:4-amino-4-deoxy-L-arabinose transferase-like glycosyltransferase
MRHDPAPKADHLHLIHGTMHLVKRFCRHLFTALSAISLLLCIAVSALWVCSYSKEFAMSYGWGKHGEPHLVVLGFDVGHVRLVTKVDHDHWNEYSPRGFWVTYDPHTARNDSECVLWYDIYDIWHSGGFFFTGGKGGPTECVLQLLVIPPWFLVALTALLPIAWLLCRIFLRRRYPLGHCRVCGYDLRATSDRCPECGTIPEKAKQISS